jgi:hypothetical protein
MLCVEHNTHAVSVILCKLLLLLPDLLSHRRGSHLKKHSNLHAQEQHHSNNTGSCLLLYATANIFANATQAMTALLPLFAAILTQRLTPST